MKPIVLPGESLTVKLLKRGEEQGQGIGYLDDGTMVVAEQGAYHLGETLRLSVTSVLQTSAGRMIFGRIDPVQPPQDRPSPPAPAAAPGEPESRPGPAQPEHAGAVVGSIHVHGLVPGARQRAHLSDRLAEPLSVFDQGEAEEALAGLAEAAARD